jgi:hypothetical protein
MAPWGPCAGCGARTGARPPPAAFRVLRLISRARRRRTSPRDPWRRPKNLLARAWRPRFRADPCPCYDRSRGDTMKAASHPPGMPRSGPPRRPFASSNIRPRPRRGCFSSRFFGGGASSPASTENRRYDATARAPRASAESGHPNEPIHRCCGCRARAGIQTAAIGWCVLRLRPRWRGIGPGRGDGKPIGHDPHDRVRCPLPRARKPAIATGTTVTTLRPLGKYSP